MNVSEEWLEILGYVKSLGLDNLKWKHFTESFSDDAEMLLIIRKTDDQYWLDIGKVYGDSIAMADDLSWHGPTRYVVAYSEIDI